MTPPMAMTPVGPTTPNAATLAEVRIGADPEAWRRCGFNVGDGVAPVGRVRLRFTAEGEGITGWTLRRAADAIPASGVPSSRAPDLDGLPSEITDDAPPEPGDHPNGASRVDHLVIFTPSLKRTVSALEAAGITLRRLREPDEPGPPVRQAFFRLGEVICEVVEEPRADDGPARFWGITLRVGDIDACAALLGERMGEIHEAVQPGRRIATVRRAAGLGVPVALITESARTERPSLRAP